MPPETDLICIAETAEALAPQPAIRILLDGAPRYVPEGTTLAAVVAALGHASQAVSTAVNETFVPRHARDHALSEGDSVLLFQPIVGG